MAGLESKEKELAAVENLAEKLMTELKISTSTLNAEKARLEGLEAELGIIGGAQGIQEAIGKVETAFAEREKKLALKREMLAREREGFAQLIEACEGAGGIAGIEAEEAMNAATTTRNEVHCRKTELSAYLTGLVGQTIGGLEDIKRELNELETSAQNALNVSSCSEL